MKEKVVIIGSGNWATTVARIIGHNVLQSTENMYEREVVMWVYEETLPDGRLLTEVMRQENENVKYLPGHKLPPNLILEPDLRTAVRGATCLVFATPLQFLHPLVPAIREGLSAPCPAVAGGPHAKPHLGPAHTPTHGAAALPRVKAISLMKGVDVVSDDPSDSSRLRMMLPSDSVRQALVGVNKGRTACTCSRPRLKKYASSRAVEMLQSSPASIRGSHPEFHPESVEFSLLGHTGDAHHGQPAHIPVHTSGSQPMATRGDVTAASQAQREEGHCTYDDADVCVLMGANVANEVADGQFCESTVGYGTSLACTLAPAVCGDIGPGGASRCHCTGCRCTPAAHAELWRALLGNATFKLYCSPDLPTVELCGALKNVIALGAGFVDALDAGGNTKAAIMRIGLLEMYAFCDLYCQGKLGPVDGRAGCSSATLPAPQLDTLLQSCGVADLITTCYGGRNRKCAEVFARQWATIEAEGEQPDVLGTPLVPSLDQPEGPGAEEEEEDLQQQRREKRAAALWAKVEADLLGGQKMQGLSTCLHIWPSLAQCGPEIQGQFPLIGSIHQVATGLLRPADLFSRL